MNRISRIAIALCLVAVSNAALAQRQPKSLTPGPAEMPKLTEQPKSNYKRTRHKKVVHKKTSHKKYAVHQIKADQTPFLFGGFVCGLATPVVQPFGRWLSKQNLPVRNYSSSATNFEGMMQFLVGTRNGNGIGIEILGSAPIRSTTPYYSNLHTGLSFGKRLNSGKPLSNLFASATVGYSLFWFKLDSDNYPFVKTPSAGYILGNQGVYLGASLKYLHAISLRGKTSGSFFPVGFDAGFRLYINPSGTWRYHSDPSGPSGNASGLPAITGVSFYIIIPIVAIFGNDEAWGFR